MSQEQVWRSLIPVDSVVHQPAARKSVEAPDVGVVWGKPSRFNYDQSPFEEAAADGGGSSGGVTVLWPAEHVDVVRTQSWEPVWSLWEVFRIRNPTDAAQYFEARLCREFLVPLRSEPYSKIVGYRSDGESLRRTVNINTYLHFRLPPNIPDSGEWIGNEAHGQWPSEPEEMFPGG